MKIAILTSSRADYSIYFPLIKQLNSDPEIELEIIAFGTHLSETHGNTVNNIINDGFDKIRRVGHILSGDAPETVDFNMSITINEFASVWISKTYDLVIALGDRYEMFAAVLSTLPFNLKIAHIHGGETTLGAIDNVLRHSITLMSSLHFVSTDIYKEKVIALIGGGENVYNVGALSIENMQSLKLLSEIEFMSEFGIDLTKPTVLSTFHPETISYENNVKHIQELLNAYKILSLNYQLLITMPNIDTMGNFIRQALIEFAKENKNIFLKESLGTIGYLSAMKYCKFMLGNSSSGFVEASFFPTKVINIGERQRGRILTSNVYDCDINTEEILSSVKAAVNAQDTKQEMIYGDGTTSKKIITHIKEYLTRLKYENE